MDIIKELKNLKTDKNGLNQIIQNIEFEKEELNKKLYLLIVINLAERLEEFISTDLFKSSKISYIEIIPSFDNFNEKNFYINSRFLKEDKTAFQGKILNDDRILENLHTMFKEVSEVSFNLVNPKVIKNDQILKFELGIGEKILDIFLSDDLKAIYQYNQMQIELPDNNKEKLVKPKV
jgi:hypothetical protein